MCCARGSGPGRIREGPVSESLAQEFEVSHKTSERALHALVDEGLLVAVVGKGFYVKR